MQWKNFGIRHLSGERQILVYTALLLHPALQCNISCSNQGKLLSFQKCITKLDMATASLYRYEVVLDTAVLVPLGVLLLHVVVDGGRRVADGPVVVRMSSASSGWLGRSLRWPFGQTTCPAVLACWHNWWSSRTKENKFYFFISYEEKLEKTYITKIIIFLAFNFSNIS